MEGRQGGRAHVTHSNGFAMEPASWRNCGEEFLGAGAQGSAEQSTAKQ